MIKFILDCDAVSGIKDEIHSLIGKVSDIESNVKSYDLSSTEFNLDEAKKSIISNINYIKEKIEKTSKVLENVILTHTEIQNSIRFEYIKQNNILNIDNYIKIDKSTSSTTANSKTKSYTIKKGDTLSNIAKTFGITMSDLIDINNIKNANLIYAGEKIIIPDKTNNASSKDVTKNKKTDTVSSSAKTITSTNKVSEPTNNVSYLQNYKSTSNFKVTNNNKKYTLNNSEYDLLCAIVSAESDKSPDDALAVASVILNRCEASNWVNDYGTNPITQATAPHQFVVYEQGLYKKYLGNCPETVKLAVKDALNGTRNNKYLSFRSNGDTKYSSNMITNSGNRYI